jgi:hypothetical protein
VSYCLVFLRIESRFLSHLCAKSVNLTDFFKSSFLSQTAVFAVFFTFESFRYFITGLNFMVSGPSPDAKEAVELDFF